MALKLLDEFLRILFELVPASFAAEFDFAARMFEHVWLAAFTEFFIRHKASVEGIRFGFRVVVVDVLTVTEGRRPKRGCPKSKKENDSTKHILTCLEMLLT